MPESAEPTLGVLDLFAGPGGWDEGLKLLGRADVLGIELDEAACATARAAGHAGLQADVSALDPNQFAGIEGLIASPPCQGFSRAGARLGHLDIVDIEMACERVFLERKCTPAQWADANMVDPRSVLMLEPLRWTFALRPLWLAWEQVPDVLPIWEFMASGLRRMGYSTWTGLLRAERYGVPQTRERAFLIAHRDRVVEPPAPTHQRYVPPRTTDHPELFESDHLRERIIHPDDVDLLPWIGLNEALPEIDTHTHTLVASTQRNAARRMADTPAPTLISGKNRPYWSQHHER